MSVSRLDWQVGKCAIVGKAVVAAGALPQEGVRIGMCWFATDRLVPNMRNINARKQSAVRFEKLSLPACTPGHRFLNDGCRTVGIPGQAPTIQVRAVPVCKLFKRKLSARAAL